MLPKFPNFVGVSIIPCGLVNTMETNIRGGTITFDPLRSLYFTRLQFSDLRGHTILLKILDNVDEVCVTVHVVLCVYIYGAV